MDPAGDLVVQEAKEALSAEGFQQLADGRWGGSLQINGVQVGVWITIPRDFPYCIPEIRVDRHQLPRRIPHMEKDGKLCLFLSTGVLIDANRPKDIIRETLRQGRFLLQEGLSGHNESDLVEEFLGYWNPMCDGGIIRSICRPSAPSREICFLHFPVLAASKDEAVVAADDLTSGQSWLSRLSVPFTRKENGWFHALTSPFLPPDFESKFLTRDLMRVIKANSLSGDCAAFEGWLTRVGLPCRVLFCMPEPKGGSTVLFAVTLNRAVGKHRQDALRGFRECSLPVLREFRYTLLQPVTRVQVNRLDPEYLLPRAGGNVGLRNMTVVVVGCGAVGSHLAEKLACLGIGAIRLIDYDVLCSENIHRHTLGVECIGHNKAKAIQIALGQRFPHVAVEVQEKRVQAVIEDTPEFILGADLICIAIGDETAELWFNDLVKDKTPRIHAWVEPMGIGGHVVATGCLDGGGCYRCLFMNDTAKGFYNGSAFAIPGQMFARSVAGCSGTFTPFACWDADRTASEAARLAAMILTGQQRHSVLASWFGNPDVFLKSGFRLSPRANMFRQNEVKLVYDFRSEECRCGQWRK